MCRPRAVPLDVSTDGGTYLTPAGPRILAHRGLSLDAPENTLLSFRRALAAGATHLETDVHATSDGIAVISHDNVTPAGDRTLNRMTMAQLSAIELGRGERYCSLQNALVAFPDALFNIDVKSADAVAPTAEAINAAGAGHRVLLTSFSESRRRGVLRLVPGAASSASARGVALTVLAMSLRQHWLVRRLVRGVVALQVPERAGPVQIVSERTITGLHALGIEIHVWTVNEPERMRTLLGMGVDGLVTDRSDLAAEVVRDLR